MIHINVNEEDNEGKKEHDNNNSGKIILQFQNVLTL